MFTLSGAVAGAAIVYFNAPDPVDWWKASFVLFACSFVGLVCDILYLRRP